MQKFVLKILFCEKFVSNMSIPGLLHIPVEESSRSVEDMQLVSFNNKSFVIPGSHRYGKCRPITDFSRIEVLGEGTYGTVYKGKELKTEEVFALKKLKIPKVSEAMPLNFIREITNLKLLQHDNIVNLIGIAVAKAFESTYLILEYCEYKLEKLIDHSAKDLAQVVLQTSEIKNIMLQLLDGLEYIHKNCVLHRDLSPSNILFNKDGTLKICDFGMSRKIASGDMSPNVGLRWYMAPEIILGETQYTSAIDIWACGCIFAELLKCKPLFPANSDAELMTLIINLIGAPTESLWPGFKELPVAKHFEFAFQPYNRIRSNFEKFSPSTITFLQKVILYNPASRLTATQCMEHPYFTEAPLACTKEDLLRRLNIVKTISDL